MAEREDDAAEPVAGEFPCLHRTAHGRLFSCPELSRMVVEFRGAYLVLRQAEFHRLQEHLSRIAACRRTRSHFAEGERIRLQDSTGEKALTLDFPGLQELEELMSIGASRLKNSGIPGVAESLGVPVTEGSP